MGPCRHGARAAGRWGRSWSPARERSGAPSASRPRAPSATASPPVTSRCGGAAARSSCCWGGAPPPAPPPSPSPPPPLPATRLSPGAAAAMLLYPAPAWVTLLARLFFHEPLSRRKVAAVLLTVGGSALVVRAYDPAALRLNLTGVLTGLAAGLTYALYSIFGKHALRRYDPFSTVLYPLGFGAGFLLLALRRWPALPAAALPVVLYLILVPT